MRSIHSFNKICLCAYYLPGTVLSTWEMVRRDETTSRTPIRFLVCTFPQMEDCIIINCVCVGGGWRVIYGAPCKMVRLELCVLTSVERKDPHPPSVC